MNKINPRLELHKNTPYAISASENAYIEESGAKDREIKKREKVENFHSQTKMNVIKKEDEFRKSKEEYNLETVLLFIYIF